jgi:hypothetical protein
LYGWGPEIRWRWFVAYPSSLSYHGFGSSAIQTLDYPGAPYPGQNPPEAEVSTSMVWHCCKALGLGFLGRFNSTYSMVATTSAIAVLVVA